MAETRDALAYLALKATTTLPLSLLRLTTLLYMSDWKSAITTKKQITAVKWIQPFVAKMSDLAQLIAADNRDFTIDLQNQLEVKFTGDPRTISLSKEDIASLDFVLQSDSQKGWPELFRLAYSTYPMFSQPPQSSLDLVHLSDLYERAEHAKVAS